VEAVVVISARVRHAVVPIGALAVPALDLAVLAVLESALVAPDWHASFVLAAVVVSSQLLVNEANVSVGAHVVRVDLPALSVRKASIREGVTDIAAASARS
jgi:lactam utilization protein B